MFGRFFDTSEVDQYADWIVGELKRSVPPGFDPASKKVIERAEKMNERVAKRTDEFAKTTSLNIYKKARLAARVREGMESNGYAASFVKSFSYDLLTQIALASNHRAR